MKVCTAYHSYNHILSSDMPKTDRMTITEETVKLLYRPNVSLQGMDYTVLNIKEREYEVKFVV